MRALVLSLLALLAVPQSAPVSQNVATTEEPHHKLVLENSYLRVFRVSVPAHESTLLHRHDLPYVTVSLSANDFMNAAAGKPETEVIQKDQQIGYSKGGFAHAIRPLNNSSFNNVTVELLRPQGAPKNLCEHIVEGPLGDCESDPDSPLKAVLKSFALKPAFATDEISVATISLANGVNYATNAADAPQLIIACDHSDFKVDMPGGPATKLQAGEVLWLAKGASAKITNTVANGTGAIVLIAFQDGDQNSK
jgi:hypothetical protein